MELQVIRHAAMVSTLTFGRVAEVYADHLRRIGHDADARTSILEFFGWEGRTRNFSPRTSALSSPRRNSPRS